MKGRTDVRTYVRTLYVRTDVDDVMAIKPNFLTSMGYHIFLTMVLRARTPSARAELHYHINEVLNKNRQHQHSNPVSTVPKKDIVILLPYLGLQSNQVAKRMKSCVYKFYSCVNLKIVFQSTRCIKSFFPYKDRINRSQQSRVIYRANCWDCNGFYIGKTKRRLHDRKTEHFKALAKNDNTSAIADHVKATGHNIKWDHFDILAKGKTDYHCKIKETFFIQELEPAFNVNVGSEKLMLY